MNIPVIQKHAKTLKNPFFWRVFQETTPKTRQKKRGFGWFETG